MSMKDVRWMTVIALAAATAACSSAQRRSTTSAPAAAPQASVAANPSSEPSTRDMAARPIAELQTIHFAYDRAALDEASRATLRRNADWLKQNKDQTVQVAGHCDQRGTTEYNLALGQRRAKAVRDYYVMLGVPASQVSTISYGKEHTLCSQATESCWKQNRRAETLGLFPNTLTRAN